MKEIKRNYPRTGEYFKITGVQFKDTDMKLTPLIPLEVLKIYKVEENWAKEKKQISDTIINLLNKAGCIRKYLRVVTMEVLYAGDTKPDYI